jgi:hypothetical protein
MSAEAYPPTTQLRGSVHVADAASVRGRALRDGHRGRALVLPDVGVLPLNHSVDLLPREQEAMPGIYVQSPSPNP